jgi:drug/metabolite transporter (DMT)-like permease
VSLLWLGPFSALMSSVTWAIGSGRYSEINRKNSAYTINFMRALFALPFFIVAAIVFGGGPFALFEAAKQIHPSQLAWLGVSVFSSYGFGDAIFLFSTQDLGVPAALAISSVFPIWTALADYFFEGKILTPFQLMGLCMAVGGVITVIIAGATSMQQQKDTPTGDAIEDLKDEIQAGELDPQVEKKLSAKGRLYRGVALAFLASFMWTLNSYSVSRGGQGVSIALACSVRMAIAVVSVWFVSRLLGFKGPMTMSPRSFWPVAWVFFVESCLGSLFYVYGLVHSSLAVASTLTSLAPVISVPVAIVLKIERFSFLRTLGICLAVLGLCFLVGGSASIG